MLKRLTFKTEKYNLHLKLGYGHRNGNEHISLNVGYFYAKFKDFKIRSMSLELI